MRAGQVRAKPNLRYQAGLSRRQSHPHISLHSLFSHIFALQFTSALLHLRLLMHLAGLKLVILFANLVGRIFRAPGPAVQLGVYAPLILQLVVALAALASMQASAYVHISI